MTGTSTPVVRSRRREAAGLRRGRGGRRRGSRRHCGASSRAAASAGSTRTWCGEQSERGQHLGGGLQGVREKQERRHGGLPRCRPVRITPWTHGRTRRRHRPGPTGGRIANVDLRPSSRHPGGLSPARTGTVLTADGERISVAYDAPATPSTAGLRGRARLHRGWRRPDNRAIAALLPRVRRRRVLRQPRARRVVGGHHPRRRRGPRPRRRDRLGALARRPTTS